ncbi:translesion DNA synthesis-associated protein ImuA [Shewanella submarina]|uniref:Translesion DNA synthesis-associated protein ImuA n=1 Tax=Shewanella submarina TaxID=2016376 RepID=A0ABV7GID2_9GAMM|nr:translesion DNA synthesis-associated protein ImuA [Shewanella submarina]MCL1038178.1 translesion DNA synthesis-associated protein ImuA [Shewanella submarina]
MSAYSLNQLLERQDLWLGQQWQQADKASGYSTGFAELDAMLADGGWPDHGVCQLFVSHPGQGEMGLLLPLLRQLTAADLGDDRHILLVGGEFQPSSQYLVQQGVDIERLLWVNTQDKSEQLWALEQGISSDACHLVIGWADSLSISQARRLQLACEKHGVLTILLMPLSQQEEPHPVTLKLSLTQQAVQTAKSSGQQLKVLKRRGGWPATPLWLDLFSPQLQLALQGLGLSGGYAESVSHLALSKQVSIESHHACLSPARKDRASTTQLKAHTQPQTNSSSYSAQLLQGPWQSADTEPANANILGLHQS